MKNKTTGDVDVSGWSIQGGTQGPSTLGTFSDNTIIAAGGYLVVGGDQAFSELGDVPDVVFDVSLGNATSNTDGIQLIDCSETIIDVVIYGDSNDDGWTDEQGNEVVGLINLNSAQCCRFTAMVSL